MYQKQICIYVYTYKYILLENGLNIQPATYIFSVQNISKTHTTQPENITWLTKNVVPTSCEENNKNIVKFHLLYYPPKKTNHKPTTRIEKTGHRFSIDSPLRVADAHTPQLRVVTGKSPVNVDRERQVWQ